MKVEPQPGMQSLVRAHRIALDPGKEQVAYFQKASGVARFAYNWALAEWKRQYEAGLKPNAFKVNKALNAVKHVDFPWMKEVTAFAPEAAVLSLGTAFENFFAKRGAYPVFKQKGRSRDAFLAARHNNGRDAVRVEGKSVFLPRVGWVRMRTLLRFTNGPVLSATVSRTADQWFVSLLVRFEAPVPPPREEAFGGVDLGVSALATLSDGTTVAGPKVLERSLKRLRRLSRAHSRKQKGSANRKKSAMRLARLHARIANVRADALHKLTHDLVSRFTVVGIEDLNVSGMVKNRRLARRIADAGLAEFRRQLQYKALAGGTQIVVADRWFASGKLCSRCGNKKEELKLCERAWTCSCGATHDRDINAALNLKRMAGSSPVTACGADGQLDSALKQELRP